MRNILPLLFVFVTTLIFGQNVRKITVDVNQIKGPHAKVASKCIGAGRAYEGLRADWQAQLKMTQAECGFEYIRFHGILHDDMAVYTETEDGTPHYNWQYVDILYDFLLSIDLKPFVELSFMPSALASGEQTVFWWQANVTPPKDYEKYGDLVRAFTQHLTERYGQEEVSTWYFEVWNEPNHGGFFSGTMDDYFRIYRVAAESVRAVSNDYRVGGPASAGGGWIEEMIAYCQQNNVPLDFISTHEYGVLGVLDVYGVRRIQMVEDANRVVNTVKKTDQWIKEGSDQPLEIHFTEWSSSYSPRDLVHDTYQNATYVLNTLKRTENIAHSMSYWTFTDVFEEGGPPTTPFHGGFGLLNVQGIKKPTYQAYHYFNQLGEEELVNPDQHSWICKNDDAIQGLIWDFTYLYAPNRFNQTFYASEVPAQEASTVNFVVNGLENGTYELTVYKTGHRHNDPYSTYLDLGKPAQLNQRQVDHLRRSSNNQPVSVQLVKVVSQQYETTLSLKENDILFFELRKLD
ncbi:MAG: glycoside hydrolase [Bacteroidota bacterium]